MDPWRGGAEGGEYVFDRIGVYTQEAGQTWKRRKRLRRLWHPSSHAGNAFADASSTVMEALTLMADRDDITVLTNSIPVLSSPESVRP